MIQRTLDAYRQAIAACFVKEQAALQDILDALTSEPQAQSVIELTESRHFPRRWPSLYKALERGEIALERLHRTLLAALPPLPTERRLLGLDCLPLVRPESPTLRDREYVHVPNLPKSAKPVLPGWQYSEVVVLPAAPSGATFVLDCSRVPSDQSPLAWGAVQLLALVPHLAERAIVLGDRAYGVPSFLPLVWPLPIDLLLRLRKNARLYFPAPPRTGKRGAPRKDGNAFVLADATTHPLPDAYWQASDGSLIVRAWRHLHFKQARECVVTVLQVTRPFISSSRRQERISWFLWRGDTLPPLEHVADWYSRRFSQEHGHRFEQQNLFWEALHVRSAAAMQRWITLVQLAHNQLVLAAPLVAVVHRPWESPSRPATLSQIRRSFPALLATCAPLTAPPKPRGKSPGRCNGARPPPAPRFPVIYKSRHKAVKKAAKLAKPSA